MTQPSVTVVGSPFGPLGRSRVTRCCFASLHEAGLEPKLFDLTETPQADATHQALTRFATRQFGEFNLFYLNGDQIEKRLDEIGGLPSSARNVVCPSWELGRFPSEWARQVERFDEVWVDSTFTAKAVAAAASVPVIHMEPGIEVFPTRPRGRRYFGIPESSYAFLFFFDVRSYVDRKNPFGVIDAFATFLKRRPWARACLVLKVHGTVRMPDLSDELARRIAELASRVVLINRELDEDDVHALINNCDAFISLHRAEGYGLGLAEAMCAAKPVIGTAYSGNMDFMTPDVARLVPYELISVPEGAYPHWQDQVWAQPDVDEAARMMVELFDDPQSGRDLGRRASEHMQAHFSFRAAGLRYLDRIAQVKPALRQ